MIFLFWFLFFSLIVYIEIMDIIWEYEFKKGLGIKGDTFYGSLFILLVLLTLFLGA